MNRAYLVNNFEKVSYKLLRKVARGEQLERPTQKRYFTLMLEALARKRQHVGELEKARINAYLAEILLREHNIPS